MNSDALIRVRFLTPAEGGRNSSIHTKNYGCPLLIDGFNEHGFDCRFVLGEITSFMLGETYDIPIKFLRPDLAMPRIDSGTPVTLWEGRIIAVGQVIMTHKS